MISNLASIESSEVSEQELSAGIPPADTAELSGGTPRVRPGRNVYGWIVRRLLVSVVVLFLVSVIVFAATQVLPSDPAQAILGKNATPERLAALRVELGLDRPVVGQYFSWAGGLFSGDLGTSLVSRQPVGDQIAPRLVNSLTLLALCAIIALPLSIFLGSMSAVRRDGKGDRIGLAVAFVLTAIPEFVIGVLLTILLATTAFRLLPAVATFPIGSSPLLHLDTLVLPVLTLVIAAIPYLYRLTRASVIEVLESDYIETARLKGLTERRVLFRHALPNAAVPTIQASAMVLAGLFSGAVVVEFLFRFPGLGTYLAEAISDKDLPVIQAVTLIYATAIVLFNLLADVLTVLVSPRLRTAER